jgi:hypothetical protein
LALCYNPQFLGLPPPKLHVCLSWLQAVCVFEIAGIAQLVEQLICNQQVVGSNPSAGSITSLPTARALRRGGWIPVRMNLSLLGQSGLLPSATLLPSDFPPLAMPRFRKLAILR